MSFPERIICMTEEGVETLYALGEEKRIVGVSSFVKRPVEARQLPVISSFIKANIPKIKELKPDLVLGYSYIQKEIATELIAEGINTLITHQESLQEIFDYILMIGSLVNQKEKAESLVAQYQKKLSQIKAPVIRPKVYIEEWDEPMISGIRWFSELVELCGGRDIFSGQFPKGQAKHRIIQSDDIVERNPDIILGCWCGKSVDIPSIEQREGWQNISAVKNKNIFELQPEIFLQPGPALFKDGIDQLTKTLSSVALN